MATIGDLVVNLRMSNDTFRRNLTDAARQTQQLEYDIEKLKRSTLTATDAADRLGRSLADPAARAEMFAQATAKSNLALVQAQAANTQLAAQMANAAVQANAVTIAVLDLDRQTMQANQQTQHLARTMQDGAYQSQQLKLAISQSNLALQQARAENAAAAAAAANGTIQQNNLALAYQQMVARSRENSVATKANADAMQHFGRQTTLSAATMQKFSREIEQGARVKQAFGGALRRNQQALTQMAYMVEDVSSVYGTQGLSGAIRAASNNITMLAMAVGGPYGAAIAVAVTATVQLWMAFTKTSEESGGAASGIDAVTDALTRQTQEIENQVRFRRELKNLTDKGKASGFDGSIEERQDRLTALDEEKQKLLARSDTLRETINMLPKSRTWGQFFSFDEGTSVIAGQKVEERQRLQAESDEINKRLSEIDTERRPLQAELSQLTERQKSAAEAEALAKPPETTPSDAQVPTAAPKSGDPFGDLSKSFFGELAKEFAPKLVQRQQIAAETQERLKRAEFLAPGNQALQMGILAAGAKKLGELEPKAPDKARGPDGIEKGSKEALERIRQRQLDATAPKDQTPKLLQDLIAESKKAGNEEAKQKEWLEKIFGRLPREGMFD